MPNLELLGFDRADVNGNAAVYAKIKEILAGWPCAESMVVSIISDSRVLDLKGNPQPFIRIWDTNKDEAEGIALRLRLEGFEVEIPPPIRFFPRPLYSLAEIEAELRSLTSKDEKFGNEVIRLLRLGEAFPALEVLSRAIFVMRLWHPAFSAPKEEDLEIKRSPNPFGGEEITTKWIRLHQMKMILEGA